MFKTLTLALAVAAVAAAPPAPAADWSLAANGTSFNAFAPNALASNVLTSNALHANAIEAHAALDGRVIGIELPPTAGEVHQPAPAAAQCTGKPPPRRSPLRWPFP